jgi:hypothetical protein
MKKLIAVACLAILNGIVVAQPQVGDIAVVRDRNASIVFVATTTGAADQLGKAAFAHDSEGIAELMVAGRAFTLPQGTKVRLLERVSDPYDMFKIRVLNDGTVFGLTGFVPVAAAVSQ